MTTHRFTVRIDGDPADLDRLYDAGADDATFEAGGAVSVATFDRDADTFLEAVVSAINDIESAGYDVISVVDDDLVSVAEIAERLGRTRQSVNMHITGDRGPTLFPAPAFAHAGRNKLWRWADVARYFGQATPELLARTSTVVAVNAQLQLRAAVPHIGLQGWNTIIRRLPASPPVAQPGNPKRVPQH